MVLFQDAFYKDLSSSKVSSIIYTKNKNNSLHICICAHGTFVFSITNFSFNALLETPGN
jgi:hypothetical protein